MDENKYEKIIKKMNIKKENPKINRKLRNKSIISEPKINKTNDYVKIIHSICTKENKNSMHTKNLKSIIKKPNKRKCCPSCGSTMISPKKYLANPKRRSIL